MITLPQHGCSGSLLAKRLIPRLPDRRIKRAIQKKCCMSSTAPATPQTQPCAAAPPVLDLAVRWHCHPLIAARSNAQRMPTHTKTDQGLPLQRQL